MNRFLIAAATIVGACPPVFAADLILCQGEANGHLQGFDSDGKFIYWSMFTNLIKTDYAGKVVAERPVDPHHGDCCVHDGRIYVATENRVKEKRGLYINVYKCEDLTPAGEFPIDFHNGESGGIDGIAFANGFFYVGEGKDWQSEQEFNWIHKFTSDFTPVDKIKIPGKTTYGIQAMTFADGFFWLGTYSKQRTYQCDAQLDIVAYHTVDISVGAFGLPRGENGETRLMVARNIKKDNGRWTASAAPAILRNGGLEWE
ncbi:MAG: hypothetical protein GXY25_10515 [Pirellulaceae bacterium]|jgi:hypothetical protein|nr:hypothetical protein [Thermoguttaceae bacterium]NLZ00959.1 hypothetical protein [Pirellulaceae bacterium]